MFILKTVMRILVDSLCILADYWYVQTPEFKLKYNALFRGVTCKLQIFCLLLNNFGDTRARIGHLEEK